jgi:FkbM family methyltransferase
MLNTTTGQRIMRKLVRLFFGKRCISIRGEAGAPLYFPPAEYPSLLRGVKRLSPKYRQEYSRLLCDEEVILDIGANIGTVVQRLFAILKGKFHIYAFEPVPKNFKLLEINSQALNSERICLINSAVGERNGEVTFCHNINHGALSQTASSLAATNDKNTYYWNNYTVIKVKMITLDSFLKDHPDVHPTFVKIDVEGYGAMVLKGAENMLKQYKPALNCEFHSPNEKAEVSQILEKAGYWGTVHHDDGSLSWCAPGDAERNFVHPSDPRLAKINLKPPSEN